MRLGGRFRNGAELSAAGGTVGPAGLHSPFALRAGVADGGAAGGTEGESVFHERGAVWAGFHQWFAEYEVQDDAEGVGDEDRQQGPHDGAHPAAAGVGIHITDQGDVGYQHQGHQAAERHKGQRRPRLHFRIVAGGKGHYDD